MIASLPLPEPRVRITYEVETAGVAEKRELPFVIGVLADLQGTAAPLPLRDRKFRTVDADSFSHLLASLAPVLELAVPAAFPGVSEATLSVTLSFRDLFDFEPAAVAAQIPVLRPALELRTILDNLRSAVRNNDPLASCLQEVLRSGVLHAPAPPEEPPPGSREADRLIALGLFGRNPDIQSHARLWLLAFFDDVATGQAPVATEVEATLTARISSLDDSLSRQLNEVFHHPAFQRLEASWRGLHHLVSQVPPSSNVLIQVLPASKRDLSRDLEKAVDFTESALGRKVYEETFGTYGGHPFGALIADFEFELANRDLDLLENLSRIATAAHAPLIAAAGPALFGLDSFPEISRIRDLAKIFESNLYTRWKLFRSSEDARYIGLVLPRFLLRLPYSQSSHPSSGFSFEEYIGDSEDVSGGSGQQYYLWGPAVWPFAARLALAFHHHGWCASFTGPETGGTATHLPVPALPPSHAGLHLQCTEVAISDRRRAELEKLGFIPFCHRLGTGSATFFNAPSCQKPRVYSQESENEQASAAAMLEYTFALSRFIHTLRCIVRDRYLRFRTRAEWQSYLAAWIRQYVLGNDDAPAAINARYPLRAASVELSEFPGCPGIYRATLRLSPHFQLQERSVEFVVNIDFTAVR